MSPQRPKDQPLRLLVADADPSVALMAKMTLGDFGYAVRAVDSGEMALATFEANAPDVVLINAVLPGTSGFEVCRRIRASSRGHRTPIIMTAGLDDPAVIEQAYGEGATTFVTKPINWQMLRHQIHCVLRASRDRASLAESEERYALAASGANDGLWDWNIAQGPIYFSPRWREQLGLREADIGDRMENWTARIHPEDQRAFHSTLNTHLSGGTSKLEIEYRIRDTDGDYRWMLCRALAIRDDDGTPYRIAGSQTDITERKRAEEQLMHDALHDALTGLANRKLLLERLAHSIKLAQRRRDYRFAVAIVDLDRFKKINDSLGHLAGDSLLCRMGERIARHLRASDTLSRIGGDEFAILFDDTGEYADLKRLIERIRHEISRPFTLMNQEVATTASVGITLSASAYSRAEDMLRDANIAMFQAKTLGKDRHMVFDTTMHTRMEAMLQMESELRAAVARHEFRIYYQPIRCLDGGRIAGFEALLRWQHPSRGLLAPQSFLTLAEESGLLIPIGHLVMREATRQLASWHRAIPQSRDTYVSVNLSSAEFAHPDLVPQTIRALEDSGLSPRQLRLEVTETVLIENTTQATDVLDRLRSHGIATAIDDFGTGYSSFSYLHQFSFDALKIDRAFVHRIDSDKKSREIVRAIVTLAQNLGLTVIAEGGETSAEVDCLRDVGCEFSQGYAFSPALPAGEIEPLVRQQLKSPLSVIASTHQNQI